MFSVIIIRLLSALFYSPGRLTLFKNIYILFIQKNPFLVPSVQFINEFLGSPIWTLSIHCTQQTETLNPAKSRRKRCARTLIADIILRSLPVPGAAQIFDAGGKVAKFKLTGGDKLFQLILSNRGLEVYEGQRERSAEENSRKMIQTISYGDTGMHSPEKRLRTKAQSY